MIDNKKGLIKLKGVFVSSGSNKNDDTFLVKELVDAFDSIPHQPVDIEHRKDEIVGHIVEAELFNGETSMLKASTDGFDIHYYGETDSAADEHKHSLWFIVTQNGKLKEPWVGQTNDHRHLLTTESLGEGKTSPAEDGHTHKVFIEGDKALTEFFPPVKTEVASEIDIMGDNSHYIVTTAYLYANHMGDKVVEIIKQVIEGKAFLSMEAIFTDYDYLVGKNIVKRNVETAFLDNFLRANGGTGEFDDKKVKRVLRGIDFMGQGVVSNPANPDSVIISVGSTGVIEDRERINLSESVYNIEETDMEEKMEEKIKELEAANAVLETKTQEALAEIETLKASMKELELKEAETKASYEEIKAAHNLIKVSYDNVVEEKEVLQAKVLEVRTASRMTDFDCFEIADEDKEFIRNAVKDLDDAAYASYLERSKRLFKVKAAVVKPKNEDKVADDVIAKIEEKNNVEASVITEEKTFDEKVANIVGKLFKTEDK